MLGSDEPAVSFPANVQSQQERSGQVGLEESFGVQVWSADGVEGDVELGDQTDDVDDEADPGAPDAESGFEGQLVGCVAVEFPGKGLAGVFFF